MYSSLFLFITFCSTFTQYQAFVVGSQLPSNGAFEVIGTSGVPAMHAALMQNGRIVFLDKVENYTQVSLPDGYFAYSAEFNPSDPSNTVPLSYKTNAFCSGGSFLKDGRLVNVGGNAPLAFIDPTVGDGFNGIRYLSRSASDASLNGASWSEPGNKLAGNRWYPSVQIGPDGSVFVASGSLTGLSASNHSNNNPTYELLDQNGVSNGQELQLDILVANQPYFMYPFLHLLNDGTLFIFVAKSAEIFNPGTGRTVKPLPDLPGFYRTYPNTGGSVVLPLSSQNQWTPDIVVCGGGAYQNIDSPTDNTCGRIQPLSESPQWEIDEMPEGRVMVEGVLLPDGTVAWVNGAQRGAQGFGIAEDPAFEVLLYDSNAPLGQRFTKDAVSTIPRLYHSVAVLALDGTLLIAGSNPNEQPVLQPNADHPFVTEFRVERYTPPYLTGGRQNNQPTNIELSSLTLPCDNQTTFGIIFEAPPSTQQCSIVLHHGGFVTHSLHMGQRMLFLDSAGFIAGQSMQNVTVTVPPNYNVAPPGPYVVFVILDGTPGVGQFVSVQ